MKNLFTILLICIAFNLCQSQNTELDVSYNGKYYLLEAERGVSEKIIEYGEHNGTKLLAVAACDKCMPAVYTYQVDDSKELGLATFYNTAGLHVFTYDEDSFVIIMLNPKDGADFTDFYFSNFYSKNQAKIASMSKKKIKDFIVKISE